MSHDLMVNLEHLESLDLDYRLIETIRHPIDIIYVWCQNDFGERFCNNPQFFTLSLTCNKDTIPWYCAGFEEKWLQLNPVERCVQLVISLTYKLIEQYNKAKNKERLLIISFEDFVENPDKNVERICSFLNTSRTEYTQLSIHQAKCPRQININERIERKNFLKSNINHALFKELMELCSSYEDNCFSFSVRENTL
jgi:hypothetical protein